jgi:uncharacterized protein
MEEFVYLIHPVREDFIQSMTQDEREIMERHFNYLNDLLSEEKLILAGPCLDGKFGIVVYRAESMEAAREIMDNDPAVLNGLMTGELHPYRVSLMANPK